MTDNETTKRLLDDLTVQFRKQLSAKLERMDGQLVVHVDFSEVPRHYSIVIPGGVKMVEYVDPPTVNGLDVVRDTLPGLWGYAENAGAENVELCKWCGKYRNNQKV